MKESDGRFYESQRWISPLEFEHSINAGGMLQENVAMIENALRDLGGLQTLRVRLVNGVVVLVGRTQ